MYTNLTNISITKQTNPYSSTREKSKIPRVLTCLETCKCYWLVSLFLRYSFNDC